MPLITVNARRSVVASTEKSLLDALIEAGVLIEHSCFKGRCGSCRAKLASGATERFHPESGLSESESAEGWILTCCRKAQDDVHLEAEVIERADIPKPVRLPCRISTIDRATGDIVRVRLRTPPGSPLRFLAGQYLDLTNKAGITRSYSIASSPEEAGSIELHIRHYPGGAMSEYWFEQAKVDDLLRLHAPLGTFFLREVAEKALLFLATGTGIAPILSMLSEIDQLPEEGQPDSVTVLWGARHAHEHYLTPGCRHPRFAFVPVLSRPDDAWSGARGYVQAVARDLNCDLGIAAVYACGSSEMIRDARTELVRAGLAATNFYSDAFVPSN